MANKRMGGMGVLLGLLALSAVLGVVVFFQYIRSEKIVTEALRDRQNEAPALSIEQCAQKNMDWYLHCNAMKQICDDTVTRMMKICLVGGEKAPQCAAYGEQVRGYNFGLEQCQPYMHNRMQKKACADTWQTVADFCKAAYLTPLQPSPGKF